MILQDELHQYKADLMDRPALAVLNKMDIVSPEFAPPYFENLPVFQISAVTGQGTRELTYELLKQLNTIKSAKEAE